MGSGHAAEEVPHTGTTIVAVQYDGGVVIGADSRVSTGTYISNRASDKLTPLTEAVWLLRSGSAADTQLVADYVRWFTEQHALELDGAPSVHSIANLIMQMNYNNKQLIGAMIVAGWDEQHGGQVWGCPIGGTLVRESWTTDGSGSTYIWGFLDSAYREGCSRAEAEQLVKDAVALAMARDGSSGGVIRLVTVHTGGADRQLVLPEDIPPMWDELASPGPAGMIV